MEGVVNLHVPVKFERSLRGLYYNMIYAALKDIETITGVKKDKWSTYRFKSYDSIMTGRAASHAMVGLRGRFQTDTVSVEILFEMLRGFVEETMSADILETDSDNDMWTKVDCTTTKCIASSMLKVCAIVTPMMGPTLSGYAGEGQWLNSVFIGLYPNAAYGLIARWYRAYLEYMRAMAYCCAQYLWYSDSAKIRGKQMLAIMGMYGCDTVAMEHLRKHVDARILNEEKIKSAKKNMTPIPIPGNEPPVPEFTVELPTSAVYDYHSDDQVEY